MRTTLLLFRNKGQVSTLDFVVGFSIILVTLVLGLRYVTEAAAPGEFDDIQQQAVAMSQSLMSEGVPADWTVDDVSAVGLMSDNKLNKSKVDLMASMSYGGMRQVLDSDFQLYVYFTNRTHTINVSGCGFGNDDILTGGCTVDLSMVDYSHIVRIDRFVAYNDSILTMVVLVWG